MDLAALRRRCAGLLACVLLGPLQLLQPLQAAQAYVSLGGPGGSVSQFKPTGGAPVKSYSTPPGAIDMLLSADSNKLFVGTTTLRQADVQAGAPSLVAVIDVMSGATLQQFMMPGSVVKMVSNAAETRIFATGLRADDGTSLLMALDLQTGQAASVPVPDARAYSLYSIAISPDGGTLYVPISNGIAIFDAASLGFLGSIALTGNGIVAPPAVTLDGTTLLAVGGGAVYAVDLGSRTLRKKIPITTSAAAFGAVLSPDGKTFYASAGTLTAIDVPGLTVKGSVALGQNNPFRLAISHDGGTLFATDLTFATTTVVDAATLKARRSLKSIAPPYAVVVRNNGNPMILNENSNALVLVDTVATAGTAALTGFPVGDAPGAAVRSAGKLFVPETANMAVQPTPLAPTPVRPLDTGFITTASAVALGDKVYANAGSAVRVIDPNRERATRTIVVRTGGSGLGTALRLAASGDGRSLLASYVVVGLDMQPVDAGIVKLDTVSGAQRKISSQLYAPDRIASSPDGTAAYGVGFFQGDIVGRWDIANNVFSLKATLPGSPAYVDLVVSHDGSVLLLVDQHGKVDFVDAATLQLLGSVGAGVRPSGIALSADGTRALVTDAGATAVTVLDVPNRLSLGTVDVGAPSNGAMFLD